MESFWNSSHYKQCILNRSSVSSSVLSPSPHSPAVRSPARSPHQLQDDFFTEKEKKLILMYYTQMIRNVGSKLNFHQRHIATAIVYFKRFYRINNIKNCDPLLAVPASLLLAGKIEEYGVNCKTIMKGLPQDYPYTMNDVLEFERYLLEELDFYLTVFHPYKSLSLFIKDAKLQFYYQTAVNIVNDSYYTDVFLQHPPHMIALAAIYITGNIEQESDKHIRSWFDQLNVHMKPIGVIANKIIDMYNTMRKLPEQIGPCLEKLEKWRSTQKNKT